MQLLPAEKQQYQTTKVGQKQLRLPIAGRKEEDEEQTTREGGSKKTFILENNLGAVVDVVENWQSSWS